MGRSVTQDLSNLDVPVSSRLDPTGLQSELDGRNVTAARLNNIDVPVSSRLDPAGLQTELNARSVDATHLNRLDATVSSRLAPTDPILNELRQPSWIHSGGFTQFLNGFAHYAYGAEYIVPVNTSTWQTIYSRTGIGALGLLAFVNYNYSANYDYGLRLLLDNTVVWQATTTTAERYAVPIGAVTADANGRLFFSEIGPAVKYDNSVSVQAYHSHPSYGTSKIYLKEYRL